MKFVRRLYDWVLHWAETPYGVPALFLLAFVESSVFPVPPDVLLLALCLALPRRSFRYALVASAGSVAGGALGYGIGMGAWNLVSDLFFTYIPGFTVQGFDAVQTAFERYDFWVVFTAGFTPLPYKIITIGAGVFEIPFGMFMLASLVSRSLRFFLVGWLIYRYGEPVRRFIEKYFNILTLIFVVLLIGGFLVLNLLHG